MRQASLNHPLCAFSVAVEIGLCPALSKHSPPTALQSTIVEIGRCNQEWQRPESAYYMVAADTAQQPRPSTRGRHPSGRSRFF